MRGQVSSREESNHRHNKRFGVREQIQPLPQMIALTDHQLKIVMDSAANLQPDRRDVFLQRVGAMLNLRHRFDDADVAEVTKLAST